MDPIKLALKTACVPVVLENEKGEGESFELREMSALDRENYVDLMRSRTEFDKEGNAVGIKKYEGLQANLISRCMVRTEGAKKVTDAEVSKWPASVVQSLFEACRKLNGFDKITEQLTADAKNE